MTEDHDQPESVPTVQPIWRCWGLDGATLYSLNPISLNPYLWVIIPFGWRLVVRPEWGVVYMRLTGHDFWQPEALCLGALGGQHGLRFATPVEIERAKERARA